MIPVVVEFSLAPSLGNPDFRMAATDWEATIYYYSASEDREVGLRFISCPAFSYEALNDESEIRLNRWPEDYEYHPEPQFMYRIDDNEWQENLGLSSAEFTHYILFFKENVFQCLARGYVFQSVGNSSTT